MTDNSMRIVISADGQQANREVKGVETELGNMERQALRIAEQIGRGFNSMARQIEQAIQMISGGMSGLQGQAGRLMDQFGRPIHTSVQGQTSASVGSSTAGVRTIPAMSVSSPSPITASQMINWQASQVYGRNDRLVAQGVTGRTLDRSNAEVDEMSRAMRNYTALTGGSKGAGLVPQSAKSAVDGLKDSTNSLNSSMGATMVKGAAFYMAIETGVSTIKSATLDSAKYAARTEQLGEALHAVAKANGISEAQVDKQAKAISKLGVTTQDARQNLAQMIAAQMDYKKSTELATAAQDLGRVSGEGTASSFQRLTHAIVTGQPELLRMMGLNANFEAGYRTFAKSIGKTADQLTEYEKIQSRTNTTLEAAKAYAGVYAASMGTVGGSILSLQRVVDEARNSIGEKFGPALGTIVNWMTKLTKGSQESAGAVSSFFAVVVTGIAVIAAYKLALAGATAAAGAFSASTMAASAAAMFSPAGLIALGVAAVVGLGAAFLATRDKTDLASQAIDMSRESLAKERAEIEKSNDTLKERKQILSDLSAKEFHLDIQDAKNRAKGNVEKYEALKKQFESAKGPMEQMALRSEMQDLEIAPGSPWGSYEKRLGGLVQRKDEAATPGGASVNKIATAERQSWEEMERARRDSLEGFDKFFQEYQDKLAKFELEFKQKPTSRFKDNAWKTMVYESSNHLYEAEQKNFKDNRELTYVPKDQVIDPLDTSAKTNRQGTSLAYILGSEKRSEDEKLADDFAKKRASDSIEFGRQVSQHRVFLQQQEMDSAKKSRDLQMAQAEQSQAHTLRQKVSLEDKKLQIEVDYIGKTKVLEEKLLETKAEFQKREVAMRYVGNEDAIRQFQSLIDEQTRISREHIAGGAEESIDIARQQRTRNQYKAVYDDTRRVFDQIKQSSEGILDQLLTKSTSVWQTMANAFKSIFLTAFKEIVSSQVARSLTGLVTGRPVSVQGSQEGGFRGLLGRLGIGGQAEVGQGGTGSNNGTTPPFIQWAGSGSQAVLQNAAGGISILGGAPPSGVDLTTGQKTGGGNLGGLGGMLSNFQVFGTKSAKGIFGSAGKMGKFGGAAQAGLAMGGTMLAMDGWNRGGWTGAAELTGGGAAIGMAYGGPVGAAIGAAAGFTVGAIKAIFFKTPLEEMKKRVKAIHGITIDDKSFLKAMVESCKQLNGGRIDDFLKAKSGLDMVESYAMQTGQKFKNPYNLGQFNMMLSGGQIYEAASSFNGTANSQLSSLPGFGFSSSLDGLAGGTSSSGPTVINITVPGAMEFFKKETLQVIAGQPRAIAQANSKASSQNFGRFSALSAANPSEIAG